MAFTPRAFSYDLNGCWKDERESDTICFSDTEIDYVSKLKIENKKIDGDTVTIAYSIHNSTYNAKIQFLEKDKIQITFPQYKSTFIKETD